MFQGVTNNVALATVKPKSRKLNLFENKKCL